jgi:glyceraldehyde 3-phosphate dehydrogenase
MKTTIEEINQAFKVAAETSLKGILQYCEDPIVSSDIIGNSHSSIFDPALTQLLDGDFAKLVSWYDNEWGYSSRVEELIHRLAKMDAL